MICTAGPLSQVSASICSGEGKSRVARSPSSSRTVCLETIGAVSRQVEEIRRVFHPVLPLPHAWKRRGRYEADLPVVDRGVHPAAGMLADVVAEIVVEEDQHHGVAGPEPIDDVFLEEQILLDRAGADQAEVVDPPAAEPPLHLVGEQVVLSDAVAPDEGVAQHVDIMPGRRFERRLVAAEAVGIVLDHDVEVRAAEAADKVRLAVAAQFAVGLEERAHRVGVVAAVAADSQAKLGDPTGRDQSQAHRHQGKENPPQARGRPRRSPSEGAACGSSRTGNCRASLPVVKWAAYPTR